MLKKLCLIFLTVVSSITSYAQFKNDNVLYKTIDPSDICATLEKNKGYILIDVRSAGEFNDTSQSAAYNLGRLKGAKNINVRELGKRLSEIQEYRNKPVFVYCSHSQRSRVAGKMLADSGFSNVFNINGGMTAIYYSDARQNNCLKSMIETSNKYSIISAGELCSKIEEHKPIFIIDVRSDTAFRHISQDPKENGYGYFNGTFNIPLDQLSSKLDELPRDREIIITDMYGDEAATAATILCNNGFKNVSALIEGIDRVLSSDEKNIPCKNTLYKSSAAYKIISATEFGRFAKTKNDYLLLDIRSGEEFANKHKNNWQNIGHLKNAVNIPAGYLEKDVSELGNNKNKEIIIYGFSNDPAVFAVADELQKEGFTNISVLAGGIFDIRWTAANIKSQNYLNDFVVDVLESNQ